MGLREFVELFDKNEVKNLFRIRKDRFACI